MPAFPYWSLAAAQVSARLPSPRRRAGKLLTDYDNDVVRLAQRNAQLNGLDMGLTVRKLDIGETVREDGGSLVEEFGRFALVVASDMGFS